MVLELLGDEEAQGQPVWVDVVLEPPADAAGGDGGATATRRRGAATGTAAPPPPALAFTLPPTAWMDCQVPEVSPYLYLEPVE